MRELKVISLFSLRLTKGLTKGIITTRGKGVEGLNKCPGLGHQAESPGSASFSAEELEDSVSNAQMSSAQMQERIGNGKSRSPSSLLSL